MAAQQIFDFQNVPLPQDASVRDALRLHWPLYGMEGIELGLFMFFACTFGTFIFYPGSPLFARVPSSSLRFVLMGVAMGLTATAIIRSPFGVRSGAHFNPAVSLTFFCLNRMHRLDMLFYIAAHFLGGLLGVLAAHLLLGPRLASPSVRYVVTVPGRYGVVGALLSEFFMGSLTMATVLTANANRLLSRYTWLLVGSLVAGYVMFLGPLSGASLNPARSVASAALAHVWTSIWIYFSAPLAGMFLAAGVYVRFSGHERIYCAKLYHDAHSPCPFLCRFRQMQGQQDSIVAPRATND